MELVKDDDLYKLITKILFADSREEVKQCCDVAIHELENQKTPDHLIVRFLEKTVGELSVFSPLTQNSQQWSNIVNAKVFCNRLIKHFSSSHE